MLGEAGRCFSFDDRAQGYGRGEGLGAIVLKPLSKALQDGDNIRAIIRNTAVNQDGKTQGITVPSRSAQEAMMYRAYAGAGLDPRETSYVEAHGTGTEVGDAIEAAAIATVFSKGRDRSNPLFVGSIKTNIGHTESTAGIAALIKTILMLEKGMILPNHDFEKLSSRIPMNDWNLKVIWVSISESLIMADFKVRYPILSFHGHVLLRAVRQLVVLDMEAQMRMPC